MFHDSRIPEPLCKRRAIRAAARNGGVVEALASAGIDVQLVGYVGDDEPGRTIQHELASLGFHTSSSSPWRDPGQFNL